MPAMKCYSIGCPYSLIGYDVQKVMPYVQDGIISAIDEKKSRIYVTVPTFPGNNGGPLIVQNELTQQSRTGFTNGAMIYFGGIFSETISVSNGYQNNQNISVPSLYLGVVISSEVIQKFLNAAKAKKLMEKIKKKSQH
jgi:hypothetical protein